MDKIEINNPFSDEIDDEVIQGILRSALQGLRDDGWLEKRKDMNISVALVEEEDIAKLNKQHREKEGSTDVLSFCYDDSDSQISGEIVLSPEVIKDYAKKDEKEFENELKKNIIHGLLHILGYEHGEKMFGLQNDLMKK